MKKTFVWLLLFTLSMFTLFKPTVFASSKTEIKKPLMVDDEYDYSEYLKYDGYELNSSNVNFKKPGNYEITYKNKITQENIKKKIYVRTKKDLSSYNNFTEEYITLNKFYQTIEITSIVENDNCLYVTYLIKNEVEHSLNVMKFQNDELIFDTTVDSNFRGIIIKTVVCFGENAILYQKDSIDTKCDASFIILDTNGNILFNKTFIGNDIDIPKDLFYDEYGYYLVIQSKSSYDDYVIKRNHKTMDVFFYNRNSSKITFLYNLDKECDLNYEIGALCYDTLCLILSYNSQGYKEQTIFSIDTSRGMIDEYFFDYHNDENIIKLSSYNNELYLLTNKFSEGMGEYVACLYKFREDFTKEVVKIFYQDTYSNKNPSDFFINKEGYIYILYNIMDNTLDNPYGYLFEIYNDNVKLLSIENYNPTSYVKGFASDNILWFDEKKEIVVDKINYSLFENISSSDNTLILYENGKKIQHAKELSKTDLNEDVFGNYYKSYYFKGESLDYIITNKIEVLPVANVKNDETYDIGLILDFNGFAQLNGLVIDSGYKIQEEGSYTLKLSGNNVEDIIIEFDVEKLSDNKDITKSSQQIIEIDKITKESENNKEPKLNTNFTSSSIKEKKKDYVWSLFIPLVTSLTLIFTIFRKRGN